MKFFRIDSPVMQALSTLFDVIVVNLLTILLCIPVVTAGASLTAMHFVLLHEVRSEGSSVIKMYFRSFKRNFKQATLIWLVILAIAFVIWLDFFAMKYFSVDSKFLKIITSAIGIVILCILQFLFPLLSRYDIKTKKLLKDSGILAIGYLPRTLAMTAIWVAVGYLLYIASIRWLPVFILVGLGLPGYFCALLYNPVFEKLDANQEAAQSKETPEDEMKKGEISTADGKVGTINDEVSTAEDKKKEDGEGAGEK